MPELSYVGEAVRRHDRDRYLCTLFAPDMAREALFALYAFNIEIAKTREAVSEPMLGQIRLQWWREAVEGIYAGTPRKHEVVAALVPVIAAHDLSRRPFDEMIDAREADLDETPPPDMAALLAYARATTAPLNELAGKILGIDPVPDAAGVAWALTGLLRAIPLHARARRQYLPPAVLQAAGAAPTDFLELRPTGGLAGAVETVALAASGAVAAARADALGRDLAPIMLQVTLSARRLRRLARTGHNPFDPGLARPAGVLDLLAMWRAARRGRY